MTKKVKVSLISTVLNEGDNINNFVQSIINQTLCPSEFLILDGGSKDGTYEKLKRFSKKHKWIKVFSVPGANISRGRNYCIKKSKNSIIVGSDAGTKYEKDWLENLVSGFNKSGADIGFGKTLPLIDSKFQKVLSKKMKQRYGSSRNIIFKKSAWKSAGEYPEDMKIGEDTLFIERAKMNHSRITLIPDAIGYWEMRKNINELKKQFYNYGFWDGISLKKHGILPIKRKLAFILMGVFLPFYPILWLISRPFLGFKIDIDKKYSYFFGMARGLIK